MPKAIQSPLDLIEDEVSDPESALSDSEPEECSSVATWPLGLTVYEML